MCGGNAELGDLCGLAPVTLFDTFNMPTLIIAALNKILISGKKNGLKCASSLL